MKILSVLLDALRRQLSSRKSQHALVGLVGVWLTPILGAKLGLPEDQIQQVSASIVALALGLIGGVALEDAGAKSGAVYVPEPAPEASAEGKAHGAASSPAA